MMSKCLCNTQYGLCVLLFTGIALVVLLTLCLERTRYCGYVEEGKGILDEMSIVEDTQLEISKF